MGKQQTPVKDGRNKLFSHLPFYFAKLLLLVCSAVCFQRCIWAKEDGAPAPAHSKPATRAGLPQEIKQQCLNWCSVVVTSNRRHQHLPCSWEWMWWDGQSIFCAKHFTDYHICCCPKQNIPLTSDDKIKPIQAPMPQISRQFTCYELSLLSSAMIFLTLITLADVLGRSMPLLGNTQAKECL